MKWIFRPFAFIAAFLIGMIAFSATVSTGLQNCDVVLSDHKIFNPKTSDPAQTRDDISAVYTAILNNSHYKDDAIRIVSEMSHRGGTFMDEQIDKGDVPGADKVTIASYKAINSKAESLREPLSRLPKVVFWTEKDNETAFRDGRDGIKDFFKRYPKSRGILSFSNIGFNAKRDQALVYFSYYCGMLCAGGSFIILEKKDGHWLVSRKNELWVS